MEMKEIGVKINELGEKYRNYTTRVLSEMVKIKSLTFQEKEIATYTRDQMKKAGFDEVRIDDIGNVIGKVGSGEKILCFDGHLDTVDIGDVKNWERDPFSGEIDNDYVYGRGSVDQKGGVAAFITAGRILKDLAFNEDLTVYFVGSISEEDCEGFSWNHLIEKEGVKPDYVVSTEPSRCTIARGQRGRMEMKVDFIGKSCHGSAPNRGVNAIYMASRFSLEIEKLNEELQSGPKNSETSSVINQGNIVVTEMKTRTPSLCAISDFSQVHIDRRLGKGETKEEAIQQIQKIINDLGMEKNAEVRVVIFNGHSYTGKEIKMEMFFNAWVLPEEHDLIKMAQKAYSNLFEGDDVDVFIWPFCTNGVSIMGKHNIPMIGFGPGEEIMAHVANEKVPISDLVKCSVFYAMYAYYIATL